MPPILTTNEQRALGCLLEKEALTPEAYPLTLNSLRLACNQKTSREPVLELSEGDVSTALAMLRAKDLIFTRTDARATKYNHTLERVGAFSSGQKAVVTLLLIRGPQTSGELRGRSGRLHEFATPAEVEEVLESLQTYEGGAWVRRLARRSGEKETRWAHALGGESGDSEEVAEAPEAEIKLTESALQELRRRLDTLEADVARLKAAKAHD